MTMTAQEAQELSINYSINRIVRQIKYLASKGENYIDVEELSKGEIKKLQSLGYMIYEERNFGFPTDNYRITW